MVRDPQHESGRPLPLLVDMKIDSQICKFLCCPSYAPFDLGSQNRLPIVYGIWHAYKYCVTVTWRTFVPLCIFLSTGFLEPGSLVVIIVHLVHLHRLFATHVAHVHNI